MGEPTDNTLDTPTSDAGAPPEVDTGGQAEGGEPSGRTPSGDSAASERLYAGKYKDAEQLEKGYLEAQKKISERSDQARKYERVVKTLAQEKGISEAAADEWLASQAKGNDANATKDSGMNAGEESFVRAELKTLSRKLEQHDLVAKHPNAAEHLKAVRGLAEAEGVSFTEAFERHIKPILEKGRQDAYRTQEEKRQASVTAGSTHPSEAAGTAEREEIARLAKIPPGLQRDKAMLQLLRDREKQRMGTT